MDDTVCETGKAVEGFRIRARNSERRQCLSGDNSKQSKDCKIKENTRYRGGSLNHNCYRIGVAEEIE